MDHSSNYEQIVSHLLTGEPRVGAALQHSVSKDNEAAVRFLLTAASNPPGTMEVLKLFFAKS